MEVHNRFNLQVEIIDVAPMHEVVFRRDRFPRQNELSAENHQFVDENLMRQ